MYGQLYGPESRTPSPGEERSVKKVPFPPVNAVAQEEIPLGHRTAIVLPSNGYRFHWEGENHAQEQENLKEESSITYTGDNDENIQESEEETNAQVNIGPLQPPTAAGRQEINEITDRTIVEHWSRRGNVQASVVKLTGAFKLFCLGRRKMAKSKYAVMGTHVPVWT